MRTLIVAMLMALALAALLRFALPHRSPAARFESAMVRRGSIASNVSATGTLAPVVTIQVGTQVSGTIQKLFVDHNSVVRKGQVIAQIDRALFEAQVDQARGAHLLAQGALDSARAELTDAKRVLERNQRLFEPELLARSELEAAQTRYLKAQAAIKSSTGTVTQSRAAWNQARINLAYTTIRSPVDGIVIGKNVDVGQTVAASFNTPTLFTVAQDLSKMEIDSNVDEADVGRVRDGHPVSFTIDAFPNTRFRGTVKQVRHAPIINHNVVTYVVVICVNNDDLRFKPGMTANVEIETARRADALLIPSAALRFKPKEAGSATELANTGNGAESQVVYVLGPADRPEAVPVATGISDNAFVEVVNGALKEGDRVIERQLAESSEPQQGLTPSPPAGPGL